jgi:hypothetical protein
MKTIVGSVSLFIKAEGGEAMPFPRVTTPVPLPSFFAL